MSMTFFPTRSLTKNMCTFFIELWGKIKVNSCPHTMMLLSHCANRRNLLLHVWWFSFAGRILLRRTSERTSLDTKIPGLFFEREKSLDIHHRKNSNTKILYIFLRKNPYNLQTNNRSSSLYTFITSNILYHI